MTQDGTGGSLGPFKELEAKPDEPGLSQPEGKSATNKLLAADEAAVSVAPFSCDASVPSFDGSESEWFYRPR
jgi:hypothetical protein